MRSEGGAGIRLLLGLALVLAAGCAGWLHAPLDVPPGHRVVAGRLDLSRLEVTEAALEVARDDGTFDRTIVVDLGRREFAVALPPGRYAIVGIRVIRDRRSVGDIPVWRQTLRFDVGEAPAVYIGTIRPHVFFGNELRADVLDEYEETLVFLRRRHADFPPSVSRALATPR